MGIDMTPEQKQYQMQVLAETTATMILRSWAAAKAARGVRGFFELAPRVVKEVEEIGKANGYKGADKKYLAVDVILQLIPADRLPWWMPKPLARYLIGFAIERAVKALRDRLKK